MMTILPALSISTRAICTPAAAAARMARVTSCCRNVEGARAITTTEMPAYGSLQFVQTVARGAERLLVEARGHPSGFALEVQPDRAPVYGDLVGKRPANFLAM